MVRLTPLEAPLKLEPQRWVFVSHDLSISLKHRQEIDRSDARGSTINAFPTVTTRVATRGSPALSLAPPQSAPSRREWTMRRTKRRDVVWRCTCESSGANRRCVPTEFPAKTLFECAGLVEGLRSAC
eukprot:scaffold380_cov272-Pinguiococcus_pyrenoidosus.AAC.9